MKSLKLKTAALAVCVPGLAMAQTTWNLTTGGLWTTAGNWSNGVPSSSNAATISTATAQTITLAANTSGTTSGLSLTNDATGNLLVRTFTTAATETQTLTFDRSDAGNVAITSSGSGSGNNTISGRIVFTDAVDITATKQLTIQANGGTGVGTSAMITGTGAVNILDGTVVFARANSELIGARAFTVGDNTGAAGSAILRLNQNNLFNTSGGNTSVTVRSDGRFDVTLGLASGNPTNNVLGSDGHSQAFLTLHGGGQITQVAGGSLIVRNNGAQTSGVFNVPILQVAAAGSATTATISGGGTLQFDLTAAAGTATREIRVAKNAPAGVADLQIANLISDGDDTMTYLKGGAGILELTADNSATLNGSGKWDVSAGTLLVNNTVGVGASGTGASSMGVDVRAAGALGGIGSIAGNIRFFAGADLILNTTAALNVSGAVTFDGFTVSDVSGLSASTVAGTYVLLDGTGSNINPLNVSTGPGFKLDLSPEKFAYLFFNGGGDLMLEVATSTIPEPGSFAAIGGFASLGFAGLRRRRRSA